VSSAPGTPIWAAGAVPIRGEGQAREVLLVHRPLYDDWSLPKGKAHAHELLPATAVREVGEEGSVSVRLAAGLTPMRYGVGPAIKFVSWWVGTTLSCLPHQANAEVDRAEWMSPAKALKTMTYSGERSILEEATSLPETTPLIILRHAKALSRETWEEDDRQRPLSPAGQLQLPYIDQILKAFGVTNLFSSSSTRCVETLEPYAASISSQIVTTSLLTEEEAQDHTVGAYIAHLAQAVGVAGTPTVVCGHMPVIPSMLTALGIQAYPMATASCVIAHLNPGGEAVRTEWHETLRVKSASPHR